MRHFILIILMLISPAVCSAAQIPQDDQAAKEALAVFQKEYRSKHYKIKEETDAVSQALKVFKKKGEPSSLYKKKIWLYDVLEGGSKSYISFTTNEQNAGIVLSPEEDFVYYLEITPDGQRRITGINMGTQEEFFLDTPGSFYIETCVQSSISYVIVTDEAEVYHVYNLSGESVTLPDTITDIDDLKDIICH